MQRSDFQARSARIALLTLLGLLAGCSSAKKRAVHAEIDHLVTWGHYEQAVQTAADYAESRPNDPAAQELHKKATVAFLLDLGRTAAFDERDDAALELLDQALAVDPDEELVLAWNLKLRRKLAGKWFLIARDLHLADNLDGAVEAYEKALGYHSEHREARQGLARALIQLNYRDGLSDEYYSDGLRALHEYQLALSRKRFEYSSKYRPEDEKPRRRVVEVDYMMSRERLAIAGQLEEQKLFSAAHNEYRLTLLLDPASVEAAEGRARMAIEVEATRLGEKAEMMVRRGEWDRARTVLEQGIELTEVQTEFFEDTLADIDDARAQATYKTALDAEYDFRYEAAIVIYDELLAEREYFQDARARMETLQEYVQRAGELYAQSARAQSAEEKASLLRQIEIFWPEYLDVRDQLRVLESSLK